MTWKLIRESLLTCYGFADRWSSVQSSLVRKNFVRVLTTQTPVETTQLVLPIALTIAKLGTGCCQAYSLKSPVARLCTRSLVQLITTGLAQRQAPFLIPAKLHLKSSAVWQLARCGSLTLT
jgi:hypothetical protein